MIKYLRQLGKVNIYPELNYYKAKQAPKTVDKELISNSLINWFTFLWCMITIPFGDLMCAINDLISIYLTASHNETMPAALIVKLSVQRFRL